jgi:large subunit ribosomal protein L3
MSIGLLGQKIGMTSVYDANGRLRPVTVIAAGDNVLLRRLTGENEGYSAVQVGFDVQKESRVTRQLLGEFKKAGVEPKKFVREFRLDADSPEGEINLNVTQFQAGDYVDVIGRSKGKGFQGVMKKHNFHGHRCRRQPFHSRTDLEKHGHAGPSRRRARDRSESSGHAGA